MSWIKFEEFSSKQPVAIRLPKDIPVLVMASKVEEMCYLKVGGEAIAITGTVPDIINQIDQHLTKENSNG